MDPPVADISPFLGRHTVTRICLGGGGGGGVGGGVSGRDEGGCAVANRVVSGLAGQQINALMNEKGLCPPSNEKAYPTQQQGFGLYGPKSILLLGGYR